MRRKLTAKFQPSAYACDLSLNPLTELKNHYKKRKSRDEPYVSFDL